MTWPPVTEADIVAALADGDVTESNRLDFKATATNGDRARKETAKDLASFAIDGGALLIGVSENKQDGQFTATPVDVRDLVEKVEQIAANRVDPPLAVYPRVIPSGADSGSGYVWVDIPASPDAPHMVDNRYYGRGERTNRVLSDADVLRLHSQRRNADQVVHNALTSIQERDPFPPSRPGGVTIGTPQPRFGHLYLVAIPRRATPGLAENLVWDEKRALLKMVVRAFDVVPSAVAEWVNIGSGGISTVPRPAAVSVTNLPLQPSEIERLESIVYDLRVSTDGSIGYIVTQATGDLSSDPYAYDAAVLAHVWHLLGLAREIAEATGFTGTWDLGIRVTGLKGTRSRVFQQSHFPHRQGVAYEDAEYEMAVSATLRNLEAPDSTVKRLTQTLLRALSTWDHWNGLIPTLDR